VIETLFLSLDQSLVRKESGVMGDAKERFLNYSTRAKIKMFVRVHPGGSAEPIRLGENLEIYPVPSSGYLSYICGGWKLAKRVFSATPPNVICAQDPFGTGLLGVLLKRKFGIPLMIQLHTDFIDNSAWYGESLRNRLAHILGRQIVQRANGVQGVSRLICKRMEGLGFQKSKIMHLPTGGGIDLTRFDNVDGTEERKDILGNEFDKLLVFIGRIAKQKNLPLLVEAAPKILKEFSNALFLLCGEGKERGSIESMIRDRNLQRNIRVEGEVSYNRVSSILAGADLFVLPSAYEGTARVLEEASALCTPCVTTDVSGARDVIEDGVSGWVVPPFNPDAFATAVIEALKNPERAKVMAKKARQTVESDFDQIKHTLRLIDFLDSLC